MEYFKGTITLYDWDYKVLVSAYYENKKEAVLLFNNWGERYLSQAHHFVIRPHIMEGVVLNYRRLNVERRKFISEKRVTPDKKIEIIRPKAVYSNHTPFGLADEVREKDIPNIKPTKKRKRILLKDKP